MSHSAPPVPPHDLQTPWVKLRSAAYHIFMFQKMVQAASPDARQGDIVSVYDRHGTLFGHGIYNPRSTIAVRMLNFDERPVDGAFWTDAIGRAVNLRSKVLRLGDSTNAYRVIHAEGDELSGLIVDRYQNVLCVAVYSHGMWRAMDALLPVLHKACGTEHHVVTMDERTQKQEGVRVRPIKSASLPLFASISENGVRFRVRFDTGHKTGFFCDQRDNRRKLAGMVHGADVLDLCSYSGGFGIYAKTVGQAKSVTCVDLDENAIALAKKNADLNQVRVDTVHSDAFIYMRQMYANEKRYDALILDPPKMVIGRNDTGDGRRKYADMNRLAAGMLRPGGILLSCSCSGAVDQAEFVSMVTAGVHHAGRQCQILDVTGAAPDHPVSPRCPQTAYLKAVWLRVL